MAAARFRLLEFIKKDLVILAQLDLVSLNRLPQIVLLHPTVLEIMQVLQACHSNLEDLFRLMQHCLMPLLRGFDLNLWRLSRGL